MNYKVFVCLSADNKASVMLALSAHIGVVKDAIEEIEQVLNTSSTML
jgi:hypothetical protein